MIREAKTQLNGSSPKKMDTEAIVKEFLEEIQQETGATLVLNGNGNGSKNLIINSIVLQATDKEISDLIVDKIKGLPSEAFEDVLLAISQQLRDRHKSQE